MNINHSDLRTTLYIGDLDLLISEQNLYSLY